MPKEISSEKPFGEFLRIDKGVSIIDRYDRIEVLGHDIMTEDYHLLSSYERSTILNRVRHKAPFPNRSPLISFDKGGYPFYNEYYVFADSCRAATKEEISDFVLKESKLEKDDWHFPSARKLPKNFSYGDGWKDEDTYSFEEELAQVRMERLDEERILPYSLGRLRDAYKRALARLHILKSTPGSDPAEISHIEEFIDKAVHKMARMKKRLDWYERARVEESRDEPIEEPWHSVNEFDRGADFSTVDEES